MANCLAYSIYIDTKLPDCSIRVYNKVVSFKRKFNKFYDYKSIKICINSQHTRAPGFSHSPCSTGSLAMVTVATTSAPDTASDRTEYAVI